MAYRVIKVVNEYTVMVTPEWRVWKYKVGGCLVRATNYSISKSPGVRREAKEILCKNLINSKIELKNASGISSAGVLQADIWFEGQSLAELLSHLERGKPAKKSKKELHAEAAEPVAEISAAGK